MKKMIIVCMIGCLLTGVATAATLFTGAIDSDFANAGNWDNQLPSNANKGTIKNGQTATSAANANAAMIVGADGTAGTFNITHGVFRSDSNDMRVGVGNGSVGTITVSGGATLQTKGTAADLFIGDTAGGYGTVHILAGGRCDAVKALEIINGTLIFEVGALDAPTLKDELVVDNNGTLVFKTDGSAVTKINGATVAVELGSTSTLDMQLGGTYSVGDTWTIVTGVSGFSGVDGGDGNGTFGEVINSLNLDQTFAVYYGTAPASATEIVVEYLGDGSVINEFTGTVNDLWANAANWAKNVPSATLEAIINANRSANLSGGAGEALYLKVGTVANQSGTLANGSLTVGGYTQVGTAENATGTVNLSTYVANSKNFITIGSATGASGSLMANSGTVDASSIYLASAQNAVGVLDLGAGVISVTDELIVAGGTDSEGSVNAATLTLEKGVNLNVAQGINSVANFGSNMSIVMNSTNGLFVGTAAGSSHNLQASNFSITGPLGKIKIGEGTGAEIAALINANASLGSLVVNDAFTFTPGGGSNIITALTVNDVLTMEAGSLVALRKDCNINVATVPGVNAALNFVPNETNKFVSLHIASAQNATGEITADALLASVYFVAASQSNSTVNISVNTLARSGFYGFQVAQGQDSYACITADNGVINAGANNSFKVATGINSEAIVAITNGTLNIATDKSFSVALGSNSTATVYFGAINIPGTNVINIATGTDSAATVTSMGGSLAVADLNVGSQGALVLGGENNLLVAGGDLSSTIAAGGYIDLMDSATFTWDNMSEANFEALWNVGKLRSNGKSGQTSDAFSDYFVVTGNTLTTVPHKPVGKISITGPLANGDLVISWDTVLGQDYNVETNGNLIIPRWEVFGSSVVGDGGEMSVTSSVDQAILFYRVSTP